MPSPSPTLATDHQPQAPVHVRPIQPEDAQACGRVAFEAHQAVSLAQGFPPEQASVDVSILWINAKIADRSARGFVAEIGGQIVGSVFLNIYPPSPVAAIGPLTVHPGAPGGVGRLLMENAIEHARRADFDRVRVVQSPAHLPSLVLYSKLGFAVREPLVLMQGTLPSAESKSGRTARPATEGDMFACNELCSRMHGFSREFELRAALAQRTAIVVQRDGKFVGYATGVGIKAHAVAETVEDLKYAMCAAPKLPGPGFLVPVRNTDLVRWLFECGAKALWPATLMTRGAYREPACAYLPSMAF